MSLAVHVQAFLKDPKGVAALTPTSKASVARIAGAVPTEEAKLIVEFGPGSGVLTRTLLGRLQPGARLVAIEANPVLVNRAALQLEEPRLTLVHDNAVRVKEILSELGLGAADCVVSGIPFFWLSPEVAHAIVASTHDVLAAGGIFVTYQMFYLPRRRLRVHLESCFCTVDSELDLRNFPPQRIFKAVK